MTNAQAPNTGHGHVRLRPDGVKARCGGPAMCRVCQQEAGALMVNGLTEAETAATASVAGLSPSQRMAAAGFTARDRRLTCDECGARFTQQMAPLHDCPA